MTEEEAIKNLEAYINAIDTFGTIDYKCINNLYEPIKEALKFMQEKDEKISELEKALIDEQLKHSSEIEKKDRQLYEKTNRIRNLEKECQQHYDAMMETIADNNKKNLMINLMAELLATPVHNKKWVIDYYKKKVEEC